MALSLSRPLAFAVLVSSGLASASATADPQPPQTASTGHEAEAEARFREGSAAFDAGRTDEACVAFADSLHLYPNLSTLLNLALCYETQGKIASAWRDFNEAAAWAGDPALRNRRDFAHQHALKLERSLARVEIRPPQCADLALAIDGEPVAATRLLWPVFLDPGTHVIEATAPGHARYVTEVTVRATSTDAMVVTIPPLRAETAAALSPPLVPNGFSSKPSARRVAGFIVGGMGILAAGVGGYFAADALAKTRDLATSCASGCDPTAARASEITSVVAFGIGLAGVAAGAWLVSGSQADPPATTRLVIAPRIGSQGAEVRLWATW
jgi:hypothetical protein